MLLGCVGAWARLATVLAESDDFMYQIQFICATVFNTTIILQFGCYWNADKKKEAQKGGEKKVEEAVREEEKKKKDTKKSQ